MIKDVFISYGRRESLGFVGRLYQALRLKGYKVWFDKVNIPDGDDYAQRISHGIESAHNFLMVLAPRCLTSAYCLIELEYARKLGKRVIPIDQNVIFDIRDEALSNGEKIVLEQFYEANGMPILSLQTKKDVLNRSHQLLGKTDWVHARQQLSEGDIDELFKWQLSYENLWKQHTEIEFIKQNPIPVFGQELDSFESGFESVLKVIENQKEYVEEHTHILQKALFWESSRRQNNLLLVGKKRNNAQKWLTKTFLAPNQPPCQPSVLHSEFITESKKNADNLMSEVFICFDEKQKEETEKIRIGLIRAGITVTLPNNSLVRNAQKDLNYTEEIKEQVIFADSFIFVLSKAAIQNAECLREIRIALTYYKRVILVVAENVKKEELPEAIKNLPLPYIDLTDNRTKDSFTESLDFQKDLAQILSIIETNQDYYRNHKRYLARAIKWEEQHKNDAILLRGHDLEKAQTWLEQGEKQGDNKSLSKINTPTTLHKKFIEESAAKVGTLSSELFISYSRTDGDFARWLNEELQLNGRTTWFDQESIPAGSDFGLEIKNGIETSDNFLFILSPASISSSYCQEEVQYALQMAKRFILVRWQPVKEMPDYFPSHIQWIDFSDRNTELADKAMQFRELLRILNTDREHTQKHSKYQQKALDWQKNGQGSDLLVRGNELIIAQTWLKDSKIYNKSPFPTKLQEQFVEASLEADSYQKRRQERTILRLRVFLGLSVLALLAACGLGLWVHSLNMKVKGQLAQLEKAKDSLVNQAHQEKLLKYSNYLQKGNYQMEVANYKEAIESFQIALEFADSTQKVALIEKIEQSKSISPQKDEFYELMKKGKEALDKRRFLEAKSYYRQADSISYDPTQIKTQLYVLDSYINTEIYKIKGQTINFLEQNRADKAFKHIEKALVLTPSDTSLINLKERIMKQMLKM